jgi:chromosome partitioning protein
MKILTRKGRGEQKASLVWGAFFICSQITTTFMIMIMIILLLACSKGVNRVANTWAISTNKGGVLKTSLTTNIAGVLCSKYRVLIVDTDNQGNASLSFGLNPDRMETTLYDVLVDGVPAEKAIIKDVYKTKKGKIDILPSNDDMAFFEFDVLTDREKFKEPFSLLKRAMKEIEDQYDYILFDTPPTLGLTQGNVLSYVQKVLIPFQPENYSMRSLVKILNAINDIKMKFNKDLDVLGVVPTLVDSRTSLHSQIIQECRRYCYENGITMFETVIPKTVRFAASVAYKGLPATLTDKNNPLVSSYFELLQEVEEIGAKK